MAWHSFVGFMHLKGGEIIINSKILKKYYIGFLTNDNDPLPVMSCYDENHPSLQTTSNPTKKEIAHVFVDCSIKENWVHIFKFDEVLSDFNSFGFKSNRQSEYLKSYSREDLKDLILEFEMMKK